MENTVSNYFFPGGYMWYLCFYSVYVVFLLFRNKYVQFCIYYFVSYMKWSYKEKLDLHKISILFTWFFGKRNFVFQISVNSLLERWKKVSYFSICVTKINEMNFVFVTNELPSFCILLSIRIGHVDYGMIFL